MIVLREGSSEVETLLIERTVREEDPASGHVAFPGGRTQADDPDLAATAVRELEEEVGLTATDLAGAPVYVGTDFATAFSMRIGIFAAALAPTGRRASVSSPREVAHVFWLPRSSLTTTRRMTRETRVGPREVEATVYGAHVLWGFTRRVLLRFFEFPTPDPANPHDPSISRHSPLRT
ncbi:MAG: NUDIX hydrolase [Thermoplasmata archaeon]